MDVAGNGQNITEIIFKEKGYYTKQVIISTRNETNKKTHQIVVVSKNKTYCVIDQTKYWCRNFKK